MEDYYKIKFIPRTMFSSTLHSDLLFGHICWAAKYIEGEEKLKELLNLFNDNKPPFLLSSAFPADFFPNPILPPQHYSYSKDLPKAEQIANVKRSKKNKKRNLLPINFIKQHQSMLNYDVINSIKEEFDGLEIKDVLITRNCINRMMGRAMEGQLFTNAYFSAHEKMSFTAYIRINHDKYTLDWFNRIFGYIEENGIGRDTTIGKGRFSIFIEELTDDEIALLDYRGNHFMSLSLCAGDNLDPVSYDIFTKYGKLGDQFSRSGSEGKGIFAKSPVVFYKEGSVFNSKNSENCGCMISGIHPDNRIVQYAYAFPLYFTFTREETDAGL